APANRSTVSLIAFSFTQIGRMFAYSPSPRYDKNSSRLAAGPLLPGGGQPHHLNGRFSSLCGTAEEKRNRYPGPALNRLCPATSPAKEFPCPLCPPATPASATANALPPSESPWSSKASSFPAKISTLMAK